MKKLYQGPVMEIMRLCSDIMTESAGGWLEGDNDITWGEPWDKGE